MLHAPKGSIRHRWDQLSNARGDILTRSEQYAAWTLPGMFPPEQYANNHAELMLSEDSIGARGVNNMANKVVTTLFRPQGSFFRLHIGEEELAPLKAASKDSKGADVGAAIANMEDVFATQERKAMERLDMVQFRDKAVNVAKLLLITGNALQYTPADGPVQVYSLRDYVIVRDVSGIVIEIITRDTNAFDTFSDEIQTQLRASQKMRDQYDDNTQVCIYTRIKLEDDRKYHVTQAADLVDIDLGKHPIAYPASTLPWQALTWNLSRGENYGRGLVEDYSGAFHSIEVLTRTLHNIAGIMGDIKFLVNPASLLDVENLNASPSGSYHSGKEGDVVAIELNKQRDAQFIAQMLDRYTQQIAQAFLLSASTIRDAERVTAEEVRLVAQELESAHGGVYSRLAHQWQLPLANILLDHMNWDGEHFGVKPQIITGMDTLSRVGEMENIRLWIADLASLEAIPEDIRRVIHPLRFAAFSGRNRQVPWEQLCYTDDELAEQQQLAMEQQQQALQMQTNANIQQKAGEAAVQE
ncbi:head-to-tail connector protein [Stappia phage SI01]|uniref:Head-to-tail connector protein n=1 Tax=Stappia phage SI01 TaxID=2847766 RepID=A0AAE7SW14_9CAUD|nr:head-to-tail connector protein [Stappia phage SI01]